MRDNRIVETVARSIRKEGWGHTLKCAIKERNRSECRFLQAGFLHETFPIPSSWGPCSKELLLALLQAVIFEEDPKDLDCLRAVWRGLF